jgi:hypothetical protein
VQYELDLSKKNRNKLLKTFEPTSRRTHGEDGCGPHIASNGSRAEAA